MSKWIYDGCTKVQDKVKKRMIEEWCYRCPNCDYIVRTEPKRGKIAAIVKCPHCGADMTD